MLGNFEILRLPVCMTVGWMTTNSLSPVEYIRLYNIQKLLWINASILFYNNNNGALHLHLSFLKYLEHIFIL